MATKKLVTELDASTDKFEKKINGAKKSIKDFGRESKETAKDVKNVGDESKETAVDVDRAGKKAKETGGKFTKMGAAAKMASGGMSKMKASASAVAIALAGATAAMTAGVAAAVSYGKEISIAAQLSGQSVEELQEMAYATETVGIGVEQLGDMSKDLREKIGEMTGDAAGGFEDFGRVMGYTTEQTYTFAKALEGMSGPEVIGAMIKQMEEAGKSTEQISWAVEGVGSEFTRLIPLYKNNAEGMQRLREEFQKSGVALSEMDLSKLGEIGKNFDMVKKSFNATIGKMSSEYADQINNILLNTQKGLKFVADEFASGAFTRRMNAFYDAFATSWGSVLGENEDKAIKFAKNISSYFEAIRKFVFETFLTIPQSVMVAVNYAGKYITDTMLGTLKTVSEYSAKFLDLIGSDEMAASIRGQMSAITDATDSYFNGNIEKYKAERQAIIDKFGKEQELADLQHEDYKAKSEERIKLAKDEQDARRENLEGVITGTVGDPLNTDGTENKVKNATLDETTETEAERLEKMRELYREYLEGKKDMTREEMALVDELMEKNEEAFKENLRGMGLEEKYVRRYEKAKEAWVKGGVQNQLRAFGELFEGNKAVRAGLIIADTAHNVVESVANNGGVPFGLPAGAAAAAMGVAQLASLKSSTSKGGGAISSGGGASASGASIPDFKPEMSSIETTSSTPTTSETIKVEFSTDTGDEFFSAVGKRLATDQREGRI